METILRLEYGGNEPFDLNDGVNCELMPGWVPRVARLRRSAIGGRSEYEDTDESIPLRIFGETEADALRVLDILSAIVEQGERFDRGEAVNAVLLQYLPSGSALSEPLQAAVLGPPDNTDDLVGLPQSFNRDLDSKNIQTVNMRMKRRGAWLSSTDTATAAAQENGNVVSVAMSERLLIPGPTRVSLTEIDDGTPIISDSYLLFTDVPPQSTHGRNFQVYTPDDFSSAEFSAVVETAFKALGGKVYRIDASVNQSGTITIGGVAAEIERLLIFAKIRSTADWKMRPRSSVYAETVGEWEYFDATAQPMPVKIGTLINSFPSHYTVEIDVETDAVTGTLDIESVIVFPYGPNSQVIAIRGDAYSAANFERVLRVDHRSLTNRLPALYLETAA